MTPIVWTPQAIGDVEAVRAYIARDSAHYAAVVAEQIVEAVGRLSAFPLSGRVVPELGQKTLREIIYGNYRIVYRVTDGTIQVLTVFHASRLFTLLGERPSN
ncbi:MAG: type II toxin-antitoxin system RelE/ParE family toxin [Nitrospirota bacterium]